MTEQLTLIPAERLEPETMTVRLDALLDGGAVRTPSGPIPLGQIDLRPRLAESIAQIGQLVPVITVRGNDGNLNVLDGLHRIRALAEQGTDVAVRVDVYPPSYNDNDGLNAVIGLVANNQRGRNAVLDMRRMETLLLCGATEREIAQLLGMSVTMVRRRLRMRDLTVTLRGAWESGQIADGVAEQASKLSRDQQIALEAILAERGKITASDVKAQRQAAVQQAALTLDLDGLTTPGAAEATVVPRPRVTDVELKRLIATCERQEPLPADRVRAALLELAEYRRVEVENDGQSG